MNRRSFVGSAAAVSLAALSAAAIAAEEHQHGDHAAAKAAPNPYDAARLAAAHCLSAGQVCLDHCIRQLSKGDTSMAQCAKSVNQMLALCGALQSLAAQNSALTPALAKVCAKACKEWLPLSSLPTTKKKLCLSRTVSWSWKKARFNK